MSSIFSEGKLDNPLGKTGQYIAACRAWESSRSSRAKNDKEPLIPLITDVYASEFASSFGFDFLTAVAQPMANRAKEEILKKKQEEQATAEQSKEIEKVGKEKEHSSGKSKNDKKCNLPTDEELLLSTKDTLSDYVAIRTKFLDDILIESIEKDGITQVVILGCGGDSRSRRLHFNSKKVTNKNAEESLINHRNGKDDEICFPSITFFELDFPEVIEFRSKVFQKINNEEKEKCNTIFKENNQNERKNVQIVPIGFDLREKGWEKILINKGYIPGKPSVWIIEGLIMYLEPKERPYFFKQLSTLMCKSSRLCGDDLSDSYVTSPMTKDLMKLFGEWSAEAKSGSISLEEELFKRFGFEGEVLEFGQTERTDFGRIKVENKNFFLEQFPRDKCPEIPRNYLFDCRKIS